VEGFSPDVEAAHGYVVVVGLGSGRQRDDRGVEDGVALRNLNSA
jgi:hypothetical protein